MEEKYCVQNQFEHYIPENDLIRKYIACKNPKEVNL